MARKCRNRVRRTAGRASASGNSSRISAVADLANDENGLDASAPSLIAARKRVRKKARRVVVKKACKTPHASDLEITSSSKSCHLGNDKEAEKAGKARRLCKQGSKRRKKDLDIISAQPAKCTRLSIEMPSRQTFATLVPQLGAPLINALQAQAYARPTPVQAQSLPLTLKGLDVIAVAATGSGKTCAFVLPILARMSCRSTRSPLRTPLKSAPIAGNATPVGTWTCSKCGNVNWPQRTVCNTRTCKASRPESAATSSKPPVPSAVRPATPSALVLAPTRELAQQIHAETCKFAHVFNARAVCIYGGVPKGNQSGTLTGEGADIVIGTPGRCLDFLTHDQFLGQPLCVKKVTCLVLDEADRMLEAGFFPAINQIVNECPGKADRQTLFFTATWPRSVQEVARTMVNESAKELMVEQRGEPGELTAHDGISQRFEVMDAHGAKLQRLVEVLSDDLKRGGTCLVFCKTQKRCDWLVKRLETECELTWTAAIHAGKDQKKREELLAKFRSMSGKGNDQKGVLVATNVAARGLDIPGVPLVIIFDFTGVENYVHQIGRTARAGAKGRAVAFYVAGDGDAQKLVNLLGHAGQRVPEELARIAKDEETPSKRAEANASAEKELLRVRQGFKDARWAKQRHQGRKLGLVRKSDK